MRLSEILFKIAKTPLGDLIVGLIFSKFSSVLPVKTIKQNEYAIAFWHPKPFWEKHVLIVPKKSIKSLITLEDADTLYIGEVYKMVRDVVKELKWEKTGYSLLTNGGDRQEVNQIHFHLFAGREL